MWRMGTCFLQIQFLYSLKFRLWICCSQCLYKASWEEQQESVRIFQQQYHFERGAFYCETVNTKNKTKKNNQNQKQTKNPQKSRKHFPWILSSWKAFITIRFSKKIQIKWNTNNIVWKGKRNESLLLSLKGLNLPEQKSFL